MSAAGRTTADRTAANGSATTKSFPGRTAATEKSEMRSNRTTREKNPREARSRGLGVLTLGALSALQLMAWSAHGSEPVPSDTGNAAPKPSIRVPVAGSALRSATRSVAAVESAKAAQRATRGLQSLDQSMQVGGGGVCALETIACGETVVGVLDTADCSLDDGTFVDIFEFEGQAGQTVDITMNAIDNFLDPYLLLEDPNFVIVAEDDDSGGGLDSNLVFTTDEDGLWAIYANHFEAVVGDPGRYSLELLCLGVPSRPGQLSAATLGTTSIALDWRDNSNNEDEFEIELAEGGGAFFSLGTVPANSTGADIIDLLPGTPYQFRVRALNGDGASSYSNTAAATTDDDLVFGPCLPGPKTLCLNDDRFEVEVDWQTQNGGTGQADVAPPRTADSGLFTFFSANNWELLVKVLDGCAQNDRYWVFSAGTTDVGYTLTVRDSDTGVVRRYTNPLGQAAAAVTDTSAFATCP